ncbi:superoxide dismutase [archaeon]|nr:superoxide dismutase [archaeon]
MNTPIFYSMPDLPFGYKDLEPHISEEQLRIHHTKHHQAYVNTSNAILEKIDKARKDGTGLDMKSTLKDLSFNLGGHILHSLFWNSLAPAGKGGDISEDLIGTQIIRGFGSHDRFKEEFTKAALSTEGSGWAALALCPETERLMIMQIEKHNTNIYPQFRILLVLDVFEHAYYLDYKNDRAKYIENFWSIVNWNRVNERLEEALV